MSDSSISSAGSDRIAARLRLLAPEGRWKAFREHAEMADELDAFCITSARPPGDVPGFSLLMSKSHRSAERLGDVVARILSERGLPAWLGALCRPESMVGARICQMTVPGLRDYFYQRPDVAAPASPVIDRLFDTLCSVGGLGRLPLVGATVTSLALCLIALVAGQSMAANHWIVLMVGIAATTSLVCALLERWAHRYYVDKDPREVVLDEVAGMALALALAGPSPWSVCAAFFAFRFFDIFKPGIHWVEKRNWPGSIVWDDLLAGLYAGAAVGALNKLF